MSGEVKQGEMYVHTLPDKDRTPKGPQAVLYCPDDRVVFNTNRIDWLIDELRAIRSTIPRPVSRFLKGMAVQRRNEGETTRGFTRGILDYLENSPERLPRRWRVRLLEGTCVWYEDDLVILDPEEEEPLPVVEILSFDDLKTQLSLENMIRAFDGISNPRQEETP